MFMSRPLPSSMPRLLSPGYNARRMASAMGDEGPLLQFLHAMESATPRSTAQVGVNTGQMWRFATTSLYASGDLPVLAAREALQNGIDGIRAGLRKRLIPSGQGVFEILWDSQDRTLTFVDNGIGMTEEVIAQKFLVLGESGKRDDDSGDQAGGFGMAKAVILGASRSFRWEMRTQGLRVVAEGMHKPIAFYDAEYYQGVKLTLFDIDSTFDYRNVPGKGHQSLTDRLTELLWYTQAPGITLKLNGSEVPYAFNAKRGRRLTVVGNWGAATAEAKAFSRQDLQGSYIIRLAGLYQFQKPSQNGRMGFDVLIDLTPTVRPGEAGYPLNAARDGFINPANSTFYHLRQEIEREKESIDKDATSEEREPEADSEETVRMCQALDAQARNVTDPEARRLLEGMCASILSAIQQAKTTQEADSASTGPREFVRGRGTGGTGPRNGSGAGEADGDITPGGGPDETPGEAPESGTSTREGSEARGYQTGGVLVRPESTTLRKGGNPLGLFPFRVASEFPKPEASRFRRRAHLYYPIAIYWHSAVALLAEALEIRPPLGGLILDENVVALAVTVRNKPRVVYLNPLNFDEFLAKHATDAIAVAGYIQGVAIHELTHLDMMDEGHNEAYVVRREAFGRQTLHLIPRLAELARQILKLKSMPHPLEEQVKALEERLARTERAHTRAETLSERQKAELKDLKRQLRTAEKALAKLSQPFEKAGVEAAHNLPVAPIDLSQKPVRIPYSPEAARFYHRIWDGIRDSVDEALLPMVEQFRYQLWSVLLPRVEARLTSSRAAQGALEPATAGERP